MTSSSTGAYARRLSAWLALGTAVGCMFVAPLDELPARPPPGNGGGSTAGEAPSPSGGAAAPGGPATAGAPGGGQADAGAPPFVGECITHEDCKKPGAGEPYRCRPSDHRCVALKTSECPLAYGEITDSSIFFGTFAALSPGIPEDNSIVWAERLALEEFNGDGLGGLSDGTGRPRRPLVMVVCNNDSKFVPEAMDHLADELEVPAVLATLRPGDLRRAFEAHDELFYLSPVVATRDIAELDDRGLVWNVLGQPSDLAPTYAALLARAETSLVRERSLTRPLRVAHVTTNAAFDAELATFVEPSLVFNGKSAIANSDAGDYQSFSIDLRAPDLLGVAQAISDFGADVVLSTASDVFTAENGVLESIETSWNETDALRKRPFYVLSPFNAGDLDGVLRLIKGLIQGGVDATANRRFIGVEVASGLDRSLQNQYALRLRGRFPSAYTESGNYYDAVYFLSYAMSEASRAGALRGEGVAQVMPRLINGNAVDVGPTSISSTFKVLGRGESISLQGTLGPPDFDATTGTRRDEGGVFCFGYAQGAPSLVQNALRYDRQASQLEGEFPCFTGFFP